MTESLLDSRLRGDDRCRNFSENGLITTKVKMTEKLDIINTERLVAVLKPLVSNCKVLWIEETESTNADLLKLVETGETGMVLLIADSQTRGKGRHQRRWASPVGGLYMSIMFRLEKSSSPLSLIPLAIGIALRDAIVDEAIQRGGSVDVHLKWPNDLITDRGKLAGILCETTENEEHWNVVAGLGVNIQPLGEEDKRLILNPVTSLQEEAKLDWTRAGLVVAFVRNILRQKFDWESKPDLIIKKWSESSRMIGKRLTVRTAKETFTGLAEGLGEAGTLKIRTSEGVKEISSAEEIEVHRA